ncbi:FadR/GntR family transcriptional regulator [Cryptosporangium sp. NPDC051539]|uniref:FadR/GntR family transcriptional regulator n=1 Tax=Cryptosporangium sp. NPDC051539 TaxID=3363962 RepID=UPI0037A553F6
MSFQPEPVLRPRLQVEKQLREAILSSVFKRGERLPSEAELATQFQVSRSTIREALQALVADGLISKSPGAGGGSFVETIDHESLKTQLSGSLATILKLGSVSIDEVTDVRRMLEIPAARLAATNRTDEQAAELQRLIARQDELSDQGRDFADPEFLELGMAIYSLVAAASGNRLLASLVSAINRVTVPEHVQGLQPTDAAAIFKRTKMLVEGIVAQDQAAAEAAITAQLDGVAFDEPAKARPRRRRAPR